MIRTLIGNISDYIQSNNIRIERVRLEDMDPGEAFYDEDSFDFSVDISELFEDILMFMPERYSNGVERYGDGTWSDYAIPLRVSADGKMATLFTAEERARKLCDYPVDMLVFSLPEFKAHLEQLSVALEDNTDDDSYRIAGCEVVRKEISDGDLKAIYEAMDTNEEELKDELIAYLINYCYIDLDETRFPKRTSFDDVFGKEAYNATLTKKRALIAALDNLMARNGYETHMDMKAPRFIQETLDGTYVVNNKAYGVKGTNILCDLKKNEIKRCCYAYEFFDSTDRNVSLVPYTEEGLKLYLQDLSMKLEIEPSRLLVKIQDSSAYNILARRIIARVTVQLNKEDLERFMVHGYNGWYSATQLKGPYYGPYEVSLMNLCTKDSFEAERFEDDPEYEY